jgi:hypothetical protein
MARSVAVARTKGAPPPEIDSGLDAAMSPVEGFPPVPSDVPRAVWRSAQGSTATSLVWGHFYVLKMLFITSGSNEVKYGEIFSRIRRIPPIKNVSTPFNIESEQSPPLNFQRRSQNSILFLFHPDGTAAVSVTICRSTLDLGRCMWSKRVESSLAQTRKKMTEK